MKKEEVFFDNNGLFDYNCSVLISVIDLQFNAMQIKFAMLAVSRLSL